MINVSEIMAGIATVEKIVPVVEAVGTEIGPIVQTEMKDGKALWVDVLQCWNDFKTALAAVKAAAPADATPKT